MPNDELVKSVLYSACAAGNIEENTVTFNMFGSVEMGGSLSPVSLAWLKAIPMLCPAISSRQKHRGALKSSANGQHHAMRHGGNYTQEKMNTLNSCSRPSEELPSRTRRAGFLGNVSSSCGPRGASPRRFSDDPQTSEGGWTPRPRRGELLGGRYLSRCPCRDPWRFFAFLMRMRRSDA